MIDELFEKYDDHGVQFSYPGHWELSEQESENEVSVSVTSAETSFWALTLFFDGPDPEYVIKSALETFRDEYDEFDVYETKSKLSGHECVSRDLEFVCLELINSVFLRAFRADKFTAFVMYQGTDQELEQTRTIMDAICASLKCVEED